MNFKDFSKYEQKCQGRFKVRANTQELTNPVHSVISVTESLRHILVMHQQPQGWLKWIS